MTGQSIDHVINSIDSSLAEWDEAMPDAMHASFSADPLPPVEERRDGGTTPWAGDEWYLDGLYSEGLDVSHWEPCGYITDTPEWADMEAYRRERRAAEARFAHDAWMSMFLTGNVYVEETANGPRVLDPASLTFRSDDGTVVARTAIGPVRVARMLRPTEAIDGVPITYLDFDEIRRMDPPPPEPAKPTGVDRALNARRNRHTGPQRNPHRHRGL